MTERPVLPSSGRIHLLDEIRGLDILLMVVHHLFYTLGWLYHIPFGRKAFLFFMPVSPFFAGIFIFLCGLSCYLSRSNWRRGLMLAGISAGVSVFLWICMPQQMIWFGVLHFLAVAILLFALSQPLLEKIPPIAGVIACGVLLLLTWHLPVEKGGFLGLPGIWEWQTSPALRAIPWLYPLGLADGRGADYFPVLPWIFVFLAGSFVGVWAKQGRFPSFMYPRRCAFLSWVGRHTLWIYVFHQPVIYVLVGLIVRFWP